MAFDIRTYVFNIKSLIRNISTQASITLQDFKDLFLDIPTKKTYNTVFQFDW